MILSPDAEDEYAFVIGNTFCWFDFVCRHARGRSQRDYRWGGCPQLHHGMGVHDQPGIYGYSARLLRFGPKWLAGFSHGRDLYFWRNTPGVRNRAEWHGGAARRR